MATLQARLAALITAIGADIKNLQTRMVTVETYTPLASHPVGAIYISISNVNPGTILGGTWSSFGGGRMLIGVSADTRFDVSEETGGSDVISDGNLPTHTHLIGGSTSGRDAAHTHAISAMNLSQTLADATNLSDGSLAVDHGGTAGRAQTAVTVGGVTMGGESVDHGHALPATTGAKTGTIGTPFLPPYIAVYMWKRIA